MKLLIILQPGADMARKTNSLKGEDKPGAIKLWNIRHMSTRHRDLASTIAARKKISVADLLETMIEEYMDSHPDDEDVTAAQQIVSLKKVA